MKTLYRVTFKDAFGTVFRLDTTDHAKLGAWLAEMYGICPYQVALPPVVEITTTEIHVP